MRRENLLVIEHVKSCEWLRRYRDRFVERCPALSAEQLDELVTPQVYVDLAGELSPDAAVDLELESMLMVDPPRG